ncbi:hypothetical protein ALQ37_200026 [Pseudomonas syringae pv. aptata]|uniref:Uncharacterized protein n=1 Tax=Pseudomonas syringae pv. aptata TaxID=83167 RepID=A0A3M3X662_PSEAP|nr:hypothetical protein [Pseudomonas syringae]RMO65456.1 hypothetical protein ALQ37_200026 [Pseudomonas syringae pv. aptata]
MKISIFRQIIYSLLFIFSTFLVSPAFAYDSDVSISPVIENSAPLETSGGVGSSSDVPDVPSSSSSSSQSYALELIASVVWIAHKCYLLIGLCLILAGLYSLKLWADQPGRTSVYKPLIMIGVGILMFSMLDTVTTTMNTLRGEKSGVCFVADSDLTAKLSSKSSCWDTAQSELSGATADRINKIGDTTTTEKLLEYLQIFFALAQAIGYVYFGIAVHGLYKLSHGSNRDGPYKSLVVMIASALIIDLPHTAVGIFNILKALGVNI